MDIPQDILDTVARSKAAQEKIENYDQQQTDDMVAAIAWSCYREENARHLAQLAFEHSQLGNAADKFTKIQRKTLGTMRDLKGAKSVGIIESDDEKGLTRIAKPMGVITAILPATNPAATSVNNMMITLKGRNAVVLAPHPKGEPACAEAVRLARIQLEKLGAPADLVQYVSLRGANKAEGKARAAALMKVTDFSLVTAGPANVAMGYSSGKGSIGVGVGNAPVIIDETADIQACVAKIVASKTFDYATSCSSENALVIADEVYDAVMVELQAQGGYLVAEEAKPQLQAAIWPNGRLNRNVVAQSPQTIAAEANLSDAMPADARFLIVEESGVGPEYPFSGEKLSVVLAVYRYQAFEEALELVNGILAFMGLGHSCGIHSSNEARVAQLADSAKVSTVLVNQPHCYNNGGGFDNGLDFTLSMGAGTWGINNSCDNITYKHLLNVTTLARVIPQNLPTEEQLWGDVWERIGR